MSGYIILLLVLVLLFILTYSSSNKELFTASCNEYIQFEYPKYNFTKNGKIFVSIASYRDLECDNTINSLYTNAYNPSNIYVGVCQQNKSSEEDCLGSNKNNKNIRVYTMNYKNAKGPSYARYHCSKLWRGEQYYLQIDSHTIFEKDWDKNLVEMLEKCKYSEYLEETRDIWGSKGSVKPVLSAYPKAYDQRNIKGYPVFNRCKISSNGLPIFYSELMTETVYKPVKSLKPFVAGGFLFLESSFLFDVPYDPYLSGLFQGEELLLASRLYTNGYDIYAPNINVLYHHYDRKGNMYYNDMPNFSTCKVEAEKRAKYIVGLDVKLDKNFSMDIDKYSLGKVRNIVQFWKASGITYNSKELKCG